jgi:glycosyltransferase involved in cell wall biosynthesis
MSLSIGIPFYNCERFLPDAIRSVFAQTYQDWELILVDDGSTDRSLEIARSIDDPRVRVISDGVNRRQTYRLNQLINESRYDFIARMDSDDMMFPKRLETQMSCFDNSEIQIVSSATCVIDDNNKIWSIRNNKGKHNVTPLGIVKHQYRLIHPTMLVRKQWFLDNPYNDQIIYAQDFDLFFRSGIKKTLTNSIVQIIDDPLLFYREDDSSLSLKKIRASQTDIRKTLSKYGIEGLGRFGYWKYNIIWELRAYTYSVAAALGCLKTLKKLRGNSIYNHEQLQLYANELQTILQAKVPGMDEYLKQNYSASSNNNK